ncbi:MAG: hypothetical protein QOE36_694, partial [Gaiellaceae bacterium]|nr:hypothetical protein [Gaiellaceae bacterium]
MARLTKTRLANGAVVAAAAIVVSVAVVDAV